MDFTALHRLLGRPPGPLTDEMIDEAVSQGVAETDDLDWKSSLPPASGLPQTDFPKDIAAMANSGGGVIAYGVTEQGKQATGRTDTGELTEGHERSLRSVAVTAITPPVFGLGIHQLGATGNQCVVIVGSWQARSGGHHRCSNNMIVGSKNCLSSPTGRSR